MTRARLSLWLRRLWLLGWMGLFLTVLRDDVRHAHWFAIAACLLVW